MNDKAHLIEAHQPRWESVWVWLGLLATYFMLQGLIVWSCLGGPWWLGWLLIVPLAHVMHSLLLGFHEAAHGTLCPSYFWNEACGIFVGAHSFMSLALFRHVHTQHHVHLTSERDEELWPFVLPHVPRWRRVLFAWSELLLGLYITPVIFLRSFLRRDTTVRDPRQRLRIWLELGLGVAFAAVVLAATAWFGAWQILVMAYLIPAMLAAMLQTGRKYVEHMGLTGTTILSVTRSVVPQTGLGRFLSRTMFNIAYHGVHHRYAKMHPAALPEFTCLLEPGAEDELPPYANYRQAVVDMLRNLGDPRIGVQWAVAKPAKIHIGQLRQPRQSEAPV